jgi:hypothetical protein
MLGSRFVRIARVACGAAASHRARLSQAPPGRSTVALMRMLAVLFAVLLLAALSGTDAVVPVGFAAIVAAVAWIVAVLIAGVLLAPLAIRGRPGRTAAAVALAVAAVVVLPIRDDWVPTLGTAATCAGYLPLPLEMSKQLRDDQYAPWGIDNGCDD